MHQTSLLSWALLPALRATMKLKTTELVAERWENNLKGSARWTALKQTFAEADGVRSSARSRRRADNGSCALAPGISMCRSGQSALRTSSQKNTNHVGLDHATEVFCKVANERGGIYVQNKTKMAPAGPCAREMAHAQRSNLFLFLRDLEATVVRKMSFLYFAVEWGADNRIGSLWDIQAQNKVFQKYTSLLFFGPPLKKLCPCSFSMHKAKMKVTYILIDCHYRCNLCLETCPKMHSPSTILQYTIFR